MIPDQVRSHLERLAEREKVSLGELVRQALQKFLLWKSGSSEQDPFLASRTLFNDAGPADVSSDHDRYLVERELRRDL